MTATGLRSQIIVAEWGGLPIVAVCPRKTVLGANMKRRHFLQAAGLTLASLHWKVWAERPTLKRHPWR